jgi:xanthine/CO dehydrogenase XdhC/CoxF family maturation factor
MKEIKDIIRAYDAAHKAKMQTALATVVHVEGSSYRRPGARMLVTETGELTGAISGGCLEGDALRKARLVMAQQKSLLVTYDTMDDDDAKLGVGLGCNGIIHILIEPIDTGDPENPVQLLKAIVAKRQAALLVTLFRLEDRHAHQPGTCLLLLDQQKRAVPAPVGILSGEILRDAHRAFRTKTSAIRLYEQEAFAITAFLEYLAPAVSLVVVGAGNDVMPLVNMAGILGWEVTVADGRANYATPVRFPGVQKVIVAKAEEVLRHLTIDERTVFTLMTHNYNYDIALLRELLNLDISYIGVLGPKKKLDRMLEELSEKGITVTAQQLNKIYGPVGLDLGAETSEEIALSVLAEIKAVLSKKEGGFLRNNNMPIHARQAKILKTNFKMDKATCEIKANFHPLLGL